MRVILTYPNIPSLQVLASSHADMFLLQDDIGLSSQVDRPDLTHQSLLV